MVSIWLLHGQITGFDLATQPTTVNHMSSQAFSRDSILSLLVTKQLHFRFPFSVRQSHSVLNANHDYPDKCWATSTSHPGPIHNIVSP
jgi:hypothetical protein